MHGSRKSGGAENPYHLHENAFEQTIHINKINPRHATIVEMRALEAHLGVDKQDRLSSLPPESGAMGAIRTDGFHTDV